MSAPPTQTSPLRQAIAFAHQAAKASWICAVIIFVLVAVGSRNGAQVFIEQVALLLMVVGLLLGIVALFGIRKHGASAILVPAVAGILMNGFLMLIFVTNFLAARAKATENANSPARFLPVASASKLREARRNYEVEGLRFDYDSNYALKTNKETGQVLLQHADSTVLIGMLAENGDVVAALKSQASGLQKALENRSNSAFAQTDVENISGAIRSGGLLRIEYDKLAEGRIHADVYILSDGTSSISVVHFYADKKQTRAESLFATLLQSLKDGGSSTTGVSPAIYGRPLN